MTRDHKILYNSPDISSEYAKRDYLESAEKAVLDILKTRLSGMDMLDMGVGGGRTTKYFAPEVKSYIGADYAALMIKNCTEKFQGKYNFVESDVRHMEEFKSNSFDFLLFSYNGIDSFNHNDRYRALKEIRRVLRPGGYFCFSSHNLNWEKLYDLFKFGKSIIENKRERLINASGKFVSGNSKNRILGELKRLYSIIRLSHLNKSIKMENRIDKLKKNGRGFLYDNSLNGMASIYYITRNEQVKQLDNTGFIDIKTFSRSGKMTDEERELNKGGWIYYLCRTDKII